MVEVEEGIEEKRKLWEERRFKSEKSSLMLYKEQSKNFNLYFQPFRDTGPFIVKHANVCSEEGQNQALSPTTQSSNGSIGLL